MSVKFTIKAKWHDRIRILAESEISSILELVYTALRDSRINDQEFKLVLNKADAYK